LDYAAAETAFTQFIADFPTSPRADNAAYLYARCLYESGDPAGGQRAFAQFIASETAKWAKVIKSANIQPQ
jgi:TolA-binding protein